MILFERYSLILESFDFEISQLFGGKSNSICVLICGGGGNIILFFLLTLTFEKDAIWVELF